MDEHTQVITRPRSEHTFDDETTTRAFTPRSRLRGARAVASSVEELVAITDLDAVSGLLRARSTVCPKLFVGATLTLLVVLELARHL